MTYDYIIIGAGSAGCVLANRLSANPNTRVLLGDVRSSYTRTVRMALAEKGLAYRFQPCVPHSPQVLALHPFGRIPALRDGEATLAETADGSAMQDSSFGAREKWFRSNDAR